MFNESVKKLLIVQILDVLYKYSDENHRLSQKEICEHLKLENGIEPDRKSIKRNISDLIEYGLPIEYTSSVRVVEKKDKKGKTYTEEYEVCNGFYIEHKFTDSELRLLIDSIVFSKNIPKTQRKTLIGKLESLSSKYFMSRVKHISPLLERSSQSNGQLFYTIDVIDEAISAKKQIAFNYNEYGADKKQRPRKTSDGKVREYVINPYQIAAANGRYYLICNNDKFDDLSNYRLDRISNVRLLKTPAKDSKKIKGYENGIDLPKHMAEHIYMFPGKSVFTRFRLNKHLISEVIDWFGNDVRFKNETDDTVIAEVTVNFEAMRRWALQFALDTEILYPGELVEAVREDLKRAAQKYGVKA